MSEMEDRQAKADTPELSVILVVGGQRERAAAALRSLLEQSAIDRMEVLLFDLGPEGSEILRGSDHPRVRMTRRCGQKFGLAAARADGIRAARAPVIALIEEHVLALAGWAEAMIEAHRGPWAAVGCRFVCANPRSGSSDKAFRLTYGDYIQPKRARGPASFVAGQNSTFKRDLVLRYDKHLERLMNADLVLQWMLLRDGFEFLHEPSATIAHRNENKMRRLCLGAFYWNWCFSNVRADVFQWTLFRKVIWILFSPLIPWVRFSRLIASVSRLGFAQFVQFIRDTPAIFAVNYSSAAGQAFGLLNKIDRASRGFSYFELNEPRLPHAQAVE
jgi:glycosyltransferase involved in cell wall biosynthesis